MRSSSSGSESNDRRDSLQAPPAPPATLLRLAPTLLRRWRLLALLRLPPVVLSVRSESRGDAVETVGNDSTRLPCLPSPASSSAPALTVSTPAESREERRRLAGPGLLVASTKPAGCSPCLGDAASPTRAGGPAAEERRLVGRLERSEDLRVTALGRVLRSPSLPSSVSASSTAVPASARVNDARFDDRPTPASRPRGPVAGRSHG